MRFNFILLIAFALLSAVLALPVPESENYTLYVSCSLDLWPISDLCKSSSKRSSLYEDDLSLRSDAESDILLTRDDVELFGRGRKVTLSPKARQDIKNQGFRGNARRREEKRHKLAVKQYMRGVPGARSAKIQYVFFLFEITRLNRP